MYFVSLTVCDPDEENMCMYSTVIKSLGGVRSNLDSLNLNRAKKNPSTMFPFYRLCFLYFFMSIRHWYGLKYLLYTSHLWEYTCTSYLSLVFNAISMQPYYGHAPKNIWYIFFNGHTFIICIYRHTCIYHT